MAAPAVRVHILQLRFVIKADLSCGGSVIARAVTSLLALAFVGFLPDLSRALDTTEPFDPRSTDVELYLGVGGLAGRDADGEFTQEVVLGYGITERGSAYVGAYALEDDRGFWQDPELLGGWIQNLHDGEHFDLDLLVDSSVAGGEFRFEPGLEWNFDAEPDMSSWGVYLRSGLGSQSRRENVANHSAGRRWSVDWGLNPGAYVHANDRIQLLVEFDQVRPLGQDRLESDRSEGIAVGVNAVLSNTVELIAEVHRDLPWSQGPAQLSLGFIAGFSATP